MNIVPYKAEHLLAIKPQKGQENFFSSMITEEYARALEAQYAFTALVDGEPVFVGGLYEMWENRALVWSFISRDAGKHFTAIHRAVKNFLDMQPYRRLEAECDCGFEPGHRWLRMLGFKCEAERMKKFRVDGGDSALYARVK
jgi:RimJ/RimL family protein N-acetyltransferase